MSFVSDSNVALTKARKLHGERIHLEEFWCGCCDKPYWSPVKSERNERDEAVLVAVEPCPNCDEAQDEADMLAEVYRDMDNAKEVA